MERTDVLVHLAGIRAEMHGLGSAVVTLERLTALDVAIHALSEEPKLKK